MTKPTYKEQITQTVLDQLADDSLTFQTAYKQWWQNPRKDGGLRLTAMGDMSFRFANLEYHNHPIKTKDKSYYNFILELDKKLKCPYYIDVDNSKKKHEPFLRLYDDRISMMLNLYGDLDSYLKSIRVSR
jgi:hypothetical protein